MNLSNLAKLLGGYINNPMITGDEVNLTKERNVFNNDTHSFNEFNKLNIDTTKLDELLESIKRKSRPFKGTEESNPDVAPQLAPYFYIISNMQVYFHYGPHREYYIDLFQKQEFAKIARELDCINISIVNPELVYILTEYITLREQPDNEKLRAYIGVLRRNAVQYNELFSTASQDINLRLSKTRLQLGQSNANQQKVAVEITKLEQILSTEEFLIGYYHREKISNVNKIFKIINVAFANMMTTKGYLYKATSDKAAFINNFITDFFKDLPTYRNKDEIVDTLHRYIDRPKLYEQFDKFVKSYLNNNTYYDFTNYISVFHKLIPYYKTFDRLSHIYTNGELTGRTNFKLFREISDTYYLLTTFDSIDSEDYKYFSIDDNFTLTEERVELINYININYIKKSLEELPNIFKHHELVELFYNFKNNYMILNTFGDINKIFSNSTMKAIIERSPEYNYISNFNDMLNYMFININDRIIPLHDKTKNILNIFFYKGNLNFTYTFLLNDNIYTLINANLRLLQSTEKRLRLQDKNYISEICNILLQELKTKITTSDKIDLAIVQQFVIDIQMPSIDPDILEYLKTAINYMIGRLYGNTDLRNCTPIYNFLYIYDIIEKLEADYNKGGDKFDVPKINRRLKELNKMVEKRSNEDKIPFYFICDILKCKIIFNKLTNDHVCYGINTFMALMIKNTNIPFNMNIFTKHAMIQTLPYRDQQDCTKDRNNKARMKFFKSEFVPVSYQSNYVYDPQNPMKSRADCGESTILNFILYLIYDSETELLNVDWLPTNADPFLRDIFTKYKTLDSINNKQNRIEFNNHLQNLRFVYQGVDYFDRTVYINNVQLDNGGELIRYDTLQQALARRVYDAMGNPILDVRTYTGWELRPGYVTIIRILNRILGYSQDKPQGESLNDEFLMNNMTITSLKDILLSFRNPKIEEMLDNYTYTGNMNDEQVYVSFDKLENISLHYGHAHFPEPNSTDNGNTKIIGTLKNLSRMPAKPGRPNPYIYNSNRFHLLSDIKYLDLKVTSYITKDLTTILLTPKYRFANQFREKIILAISGDRPEHTDFFLKYKDTPKFLYMCEYIKLYLPRISIKRVNLHISLQDTEFLVSIFGSNNPPTFNNYIRELGQLLNQYYSNKVMTDKVMTDKVMTAKILTVLKIRDNDDLLKMIIKNHFHLLYDKLKQEIGPNNIVCSLNRIFKEDYNVLHYMYDKLLKLKNTEFEDQTIHIIDDINVLDNTYNTNKLNNMRDRLKRFPYEIILFSDFSYEKMQYICENNIRDSTFILTILRNYYKFGNPDYDNLENFLEVLCRPIYKNYITPDLKGNLQVLFLTVALHTRNYEGFQEFENIYKPINKFRYFETYPMELLTKMDPNIERLMYMSQRNLVKYRFFTNHPDLIFPFIYNNNILNEFIVDSSFIRKYMKLENIHRYTGRDIFGNTIYDYIAMYYMYNYSMDTSPSSYQVLQMTFRNRDLNIIELTNSDGWSILDILSIMPINFDIIQNPKVIENIKAHIDLLLEIYTLRDFRDTDKILVYRHILAKYFYIFEGVNKLLGMINNYIRDKPTIDSQYITNPLFDLYKYCSRVDTSTLTLILQNYDNNKRFICNKIPSQRLYDYVVKDYEGDRVIPLHPFPREKWYILLPINSPLPQFIIPIKRILGRVLEEERRRGINDSLSVV